MKKEVLDHCFAANKVYEDSYKIVTVKNVLPILLEDPHRLLDPNNVDSFLLASFFAQYPDLVTFHPQWKQGTTAVSLILMFTYTLESWQWTEESLRWDIG